MPSPFLERQPADPQACIAAVLLDVLGKPQMKRNPRSAPTQFQKDLAQEIWEAINQRAVRRMPGRFEIPDHLQPRGVAELIQGLLVEMPEPGQVWAAEDRARWMAVAAAIFRVIYEEAPS